MTSSSLPPAGGRPPGKEVKRAVVDFLRDRFDLRDDQAYEGETMEAVRRDVQFRGANLWILLFAILICSIGLNVNSPAVVIGAMLISPLMGPILGIGVGVAVYDFDLLLTALKNLLIATVASVFVSSIYFAISPITEAQSELLARVSPTLWDVLIATFGGFAGIIAVSRREKGNALPGVAIATALMPPICTAGYALATAQWKYFFGSGYLFFINVTFIAFSTFVLARFMKFARQQFVDPAQERYVRRWITGIVAVVAIPSVYTAYNTVERSVYLQRATAFVEEQCDFVGAEVVSRRIVGVKDNEARSIEIVLIGREVSQGAIDSSAARMAEYGLTGTDLVVLQDKDERGATPAQLAMMRRLLESDRIYAGRQAARIQPIDDGLMAGLGARWVRSPGEDSTLFEEARVLVPALADIAVAEFARYRDVRGESRLREAAVRVLPVGTDSVSAQETVLLARWLRARLKADTVYIVP